MTLIKLALLGANFGLSNRCIQAPSVKALPTSYTDIEKKSYARIRLNPRSIRRPDRRDCRYFFLVTF